MDSISEWHCPGMISVHKVSKGVFERRLGASTLPGAVLIPRYLSCLQVVWGVRELKCRSMCTSESRCTHYTFTRLNMPNSKSATGKCRVHAECPTQVTQAISLTGTRCPNLLDDCGH